MVEALWLGNKCLSSNFICVRKHHLGLSTPFSAEQPNQANSYLQMQCPVMVVILLPLISVTFIEAWSLPCCSPGFCLLSGCCLLWKFPFAFSFLTTGSPTAPAYPPAATCLQRYSLSRRHPVSIHFILQILLRPTAHYTVGLRAQETWMRKSGIVLASWNLVS